MEPSDSLSFRIVCGGRWTVDGRWVVLAICGDSEHIAFDPDNAAGALHIGDAEGPPEWASILDLKDCRGYIEEVRPSMTLQRKAVRVLKRDHRHRPLIVAVRSPSSPVEVVAERGPLEWYPAYGIRVRDDQVVDLPRGFALNRAMLEALDGAE